MNEFERVAGQYYDLMWGQNILSATATFIPAILRERSYEKILAAAQELQLRKAKVDRAFSQSGNEDAMVWYGVSLCYSPAMGYLRAIDNLVGATKGSAEKPSFSDAAKDLVMGLGTIKTLEGVIDLCLPDAS